MFESVVYQYLFDTEKSLHHRPHDDSVSPEADSSAGWNTAALALVSDIIQSLSD